MKKRILALFLALLTVSGTLASCSESGTNPEEKATAESGTPAAEETEVPAEAAEEDLSSAEQRQRIPDNLPEADFGGREFTACVEERKKFEILSEELTGEATNDSVYDRNLRIEDRFNVSIKMVENAAPQNDVVTNVTSGTYAYDLCGFNNFQTYTPVSAGVLYNWCEIPNVDLTQPWHNKLANDTATINGKLYGINSDISISTLLYTYGMFFNYAIMERYGYTSNDLYNIVFEGNWTVDKVKEIAGGIYEDTNGDGKHDKDDIHGYVVSSSQVNTHDVWLAALDLPLMDIRSVDDYEVTFFCEKTVSALEKVISLYHDTEGSFMEPSGDWRQVPTLFANGKIAMSQLYFGETTESLTEMEDTYGILPLPKFDETQEQYMTNAWDQFTVYAVPLTMTEADGPFVGTVYEALCAESYKTVFPAYYDVMLKSRYSAEPATAQMIDMIMAGRKLEFSFQFGEKLSRLPYQFRDMVCAGETDAASRYKKIQKSLDKVIGKTLEVYADE